MSTADHTKMNVRGYNEYTGRCSINRRDALSAPRMFSIPEGAIGTLGHFCKSK